VYYPTIVLYLLGIVDNCVKPVHMKDHNKYTFNKMELPKFRVPFSCMIVGPTMSGKTTIVKKIIENHQSLFDNPPTSIHYCYSQWQDTYTYLMKLGVVFHLGLPDVKQFEHNKSRSTLLIMDDLMQESSNSEEVGNIFTHYCHHWNLSCIQICQNLFYKGLRNSRINYQYLILMKNPADKLQATNLAKQIYPGTTFYFLESLRDATSNPFGYLVVDLTVSCPENVRLRTNIFPDEFPMIVYYPSKNRK
jgi:hypothetical protein